MTRCVDVVLSIPDNEALTALATLQRLGVPVGGVTRADLYRCEVEEGAGDLLETLRGIETVFNPNKHRIAVRVGAAPLAGEAWIEALDDATATGGLAGRASPASISGRVLPGVRRLERFTAWRIFGRDGEPAAASVVTAAVETLLCNPAFQKATMT